MRVKMGSVCCIAARDRTIITGSSSDVIPRNVRYSPSWSIRWDNRRRVAGEETSINWFSDGVGATDRLDNKSQTTLETAYASEEGSPLESFQNLNQQKPSPFDRNMIPQSDQSNSRNPLEVKESIETPVAWEPSPTKTSPSSRSVSSFSASPWSTSQRHLLPPSSLTLPRWSRHSPGHHLLSQISDGWNPGMKSPNFSMSEEGSPFMLPAGWSYESNRVSHGGSSDGWSIPASSELMATSHRERWSFDSESLSFSRDKISRSSGRISSSSPLIDAQTCGVCSKLLTEKSCWGSQKIIATNELAVVAVLMCGHVYHAECLENMTPEINKYDPACPVCTFGEKKALKLSEKAHRADMELKCKISKKSKRRVVDGDMNDNSIILDCHKSAGHEVRGPEISSSSSIKNSIGKPFLKRHFSFGSKGSRSLSESNSSRKKGFFWAKSSKE